MARYRIDLADAWAKVDRAKEHIDDLRERVLREVGTEPYRIPLVKEFERDEVTPDGGIFWFRVQSVIDVPEKWGLIASDAINNLRSALDYLAWQLALRYHNGIIPPGEVGNVQFPIDSARSQWRAKDSRRWRNMSLNDAIKLRKFQPFSRGRRRKQAVVSHPLPFMEKAPMVIRRHPLAEIRDFSNDDKHRVMQPTELYRGVTEFQIIINAVDCTNVQIIPLQTPDAPQPGDPIFRLNVTITGPDPDVDFKGNLAGYVALRGWPLVATLDGLAKVVEITLDAFQPRANLPRR